MSNQRFSPEFKDEAVRQIVDRGYSVTEVSERLGASAHSLYKWVKAIKPDKTDEQATPVRVPDASVCPARISTFPSIKQSAIQPKICRSPHNESFRKNDGLFFNYRWL